MFGLLNLNKPAGMTSRDLVNVVQRLVRPVKVGHAGTLDPMATGVLVVCLGKATRLVPFLHNERKHYRAEFTLGQRSDTDDATGEIETVQAASPPAIADVESVLTSFVGSIRQVPPQFSAVHVAGQRAYAMARAGKVVDLESKVVEVFRINVVHYAWPTLQVEIECGSGTYIRSIARDLGEQLGCGGLMSQLERTQVGSCHIGYALDAQSLSAESIRRRLIAPMTAVRSLRSMRCTGGDFGLIAQGKQIAWDPSRVAEAAAGAPAPPPELARLIAVLSEDGTELLCLAERSTRHKTLQPRQVFLDSEQQRSET